MNTQMEDNKGRNCLRLCTRSVHQAASHHGCVPSSKRPTIILTVLLATAVPAISLETGAGATSGTASKGIDAGAMVHIPAGAFVMGCEQSEHGCEADEAPLHSVVITRGFMIGVSEVTNAQYRSCVSIGVCSPPQLRAPATDASSQEQVPVLGVSWQQAETFCRASGGRLPTEAEWEYAAAGGARSPRRYPWGDEDPSCRLGAKNGARYDDDLDCNNTGPTSVGAYSPNEFGLVDLAGNAWEWTSDFYGPEYYARSPRRDPTGPEAGDQRVARGGGWSSSSSALRNSNRMGVRGGGAAANIGFRCVKEVTE